MCLLTLRISGAPLVLQKLCYVFLSSLQVTKREDIDSFLKQNFTKSMRIRDTVTELDQAEVGYVNASLSCLFCL